MAMMLVATARANITEATIFSFNVEIPFTFLPLFQKQLIRFEPESVRSTEDELINGVPQDNCSWKDECYRDSRS